MAQIIRAYRSHLATGPAGVAYEPLVFKDTQAANDAAMGSSLWDTCPSLVEQCEPGYMNYLDTKWFGATPATNAVGGWTTTTATSGAVTIDATYGLKIDAGATTANQGVNFQLTRSPFQLAAGKAIWCEGNFRFTGLTTLTLQFLFGLVVPKTTIITSGAVGTDDKIAIGAVSSSAALVCNTTASATTSTATALTLANTSTHRLGFYATSSNVDFWVDGTLTNSITTNIPTSALSPSIVVQSNGTVQPIIYCDWLRVVSIR